MKKDYAAYLELAARCHVFLLLNTYGLGKVMGGQFYRRGQLPEEIAQQTLAEVGGFDLAWTFMGYSYTYILFIGVSQIIGAWCLLWERTKFLGMAILIPILLNIIVFDLIFFEKYGALASAVNYLLLLLLVLYLNREQTLAILQKMTQANPPFLQGSFQEKAKTIGIVILMMAAIFGVEQFFVNLLGH